MRGDIPIHTEHVVSDDQRIRRFRTMLFQKRGQMRHIVMFEAHQPRPAQLRRIEDAGMH